MERKLRLKRWTEDYGGREDEELKWNGEEKKMKIKMKMKERQWTKGRKQEWILKERRKNAGKMRRRAREEIKRWEVGRWDKEEEEEKRRKIQ